MHQLQEDHSDATVELEVRGRVGIAAELASEVDAPCRWLDVGCASGYLIAAASRLGHSTQGVEISEWAAGFAVDKMGLDVFHGTLAEFARRMPGRCFNLITAMAYLEHSPSPMQDMRLLAGLLEPGGALVLRVPNLASFDRHWHGDLWRGWSLPYHLHHFSPRDMHYLAHEAGLMVYRLDKGFWNPIVHAREALRGEGRRADHPLEGRPSLKSEAASGRAHVVGQATMRGRVKARLGELLSGRDMVVYARK